MFSTSASIITCGEYIYSNSFRTQTLVPSFFPRGSSSPFTIFVKFGLLGYIFQKLLERSSVNTLRMYTLIQKITAVNTNTRAREKQIPNQRCCVGGSARAPPKFSTLISDYHIWRYIFFNFSPFDNPRRRFSTKKIKVQKSKYAGVAAKLFSLDRFGPEARLPTYRSHAELCIFQIFIFRSIPPHRPSAHSNVYSK